LEVVQNAAELARWTGRDNDTRPALAVDLAALLRADGVSHFRGCEQVLFADRRERFLVVILAVLHRDLRHLNAHRAVDEDRNRRHLIRLNETLHVPEDDLRPSN